MGTLTRPNIAGGSHGLSSTDWLQTGEGMAAATLADQVATATVAQDLAFGGTEQPGRREEIRSQSFEQSYQQYLDGLDAEH